MKRVAQIHKESLYKTSTLQAETDNEIADGNKMIIYRFRYCFNTFLCG